MDWSIFEFEPERKCRELFSDFCCWLLVVMAQYELDSVADESDVMDDEGEE